MPHKMCIRDSYRVNHGFVLFLLPIGGALVSFLYYKCGRNSVKGNNLIIENINNYCGDNLGDFPDGYDNKSNEQRREIVDKEAQFFGTKYIVDVYKRQLPPLLILDASPKAMMCIRDSPLCVGLHTCYNGWYREMQYREVEPNLKMCIRDSLLLIYNSILV